MTEASLPAKRGLYIRTFGCQMNEYDTLKISKLLEKDYVSVDEPEKADLVLINTCSVREKPEHKLYSLLGEMEELKADKRDLLIGVCGCVAQQEGDNIVKRSRAVDFVFGTHNISLVPSLIESRQKGMPPQVAVDYRDGWEDLPIGFPEGTRVSAFVAISRGCNKNCTYCIVPTTRGKEVSRSADEIEREVRLAVHRGAKEVVLLGQTVNSYGIDLTPRSSFVSLLEKISKIDGLERIRFTSPHPQEVRRDFIDHVCSNPKVCRHIHMPLQSGSDRILKAMNRNYRRKKYLSIIEALKSEVPEMAITTDIIVGFPGETEEDFDDTMSVLEAVRFESSFSFMYSPRPGTPAASMPGQLPEEVKLERLQRLQARQGEITTEKLKAWIGRVEEVLVDGDSAYLDPESGEATLKGRISQNILVNLRSGPDFPGIKPGNLVSAHITASSKYTLRGDALAFKCQ